MARLRSEIWVAAFLRRHNQLGRICVVSRRGDPSAGQIWIEIDHLNGTVSLLVPASAGLDAIEGEGRKFTRRFDRAEAVSVSERIAREAEFDPDVWVVTLEDRDGDHGLELVADP
ncbi:MAG TPA: DUF1491 family protein [Devosiaceae bacterium]|nr:DUF1491 family protein [Devosiaceae bacterium]